MAISSLKCILTGRFQWLKNEKDKTKLLDKFRSLRKQRAVISM